MASSGWLRRVCTAGTQQDELGLPAGQGQGAGQPTRQMALDPAPWVCDDSDAPCPIPRQQVPRPLPGQPPVEERVGAMPAGQWAGGPGKPWGLCSSRARQAGAAPEPQEHLSSQRHSPLGGPQSRAGPDGDGCQGHRRYASSWPQGGADLGSAACVFPVASLSPQPQPEWCLLGPGVPPAEGGPHETERPPRARLRRVGRSCAPCHLSLCKLA